MVPELLVLALDYSRAPLRYANLLDREDPLPACFDTMVSALGGAMAPPQVAATAAALGTTEPILRSALLVFFRQVMLRAGADHYRTLGLSRTASPEAITAHYHALVRLFHPDRADEQALDRSAADTARLNSAYRVLRNPTARARYDRELTKTGRAPSARASRDRRRWPVLWTREVPRVAVSRRLLIGGLVLLVTAALVVMLGQDRETLRMGDDAAVRRPAHPGPAFLTTTQAAAATVGAVQPAALPNGGRDPVPTIPETSVPKIPKIGALVAPPTAPAASPEEVLERFRRLFAAGDLQSILLLLADGARIASLGSAPVGGAGADFFEATVKKTLYLSDLRLEGDGSPQLVASGTLHRLDGRGADNRASAAPVGEIRLEMNGKDAGYRIAALLYRLEPKLMEPHN